MRKKKNWLSMDIIGHGHRLLLKLLRDSLWSDGLNYLFCLWYYSVLWSVVYPLHIRRTVRVHQLFFFYTFFSVCCVLWARRATFVAVHTCLVKSHRPRAHIHIASNMKQPHFDVAEAEVEGLNCVTFKHSIIIKLASLIARMFIYYYLVWGVVAKWSK